MATSLNLEYRPKESTFSEDVTLRPYLDEEKEEIYKQTSGHTLCQRTRRKKDNAKMSKVESLT